MKKNNFILALAILFFGFGSSLAQSKSNANLDEAKKAIAESNAVYFTAFVKNDPSIFVARYAEDACIMPPDSQPLCGPSAAAEFFKIAYDQILLRNGSFTTTAVYGDGKEFATEEGRWFSYDANNNLMDDGKFLVLWKKTPKGWKMFRDSFSSNRTKIN